MDFSRIALFPMWFVPFLFALCFHEFAHGFIAKRRGDNTAQLMGRLTMNPLVHMDLVGTLLMPFLAFITGLPIFFGWAKPVPVNPRNLRNPLVDMFWIALAGPLSNILLAAVGSALMFASFHLLMGQTYFKSVMEFFDAFIVINLFLAVFNMIPIHPLDGGKVIARFLPREWNYKLEQNEQMLSLVLLALIMLGATKFLVAPVMFIRSALMFWQGYL